MSSVNLILAAFAFILFPGSVHSFTSRASSPAHQPTKNIDLSNLQKSVARRRKTSLNDLSEWRDLFFDDSEQPQQVKQLMQTENLEGPAREICILPFPLNDVLLQGETKELCLYEERFHQLFEKAQNSHCGVVAMGFLAPPSGILQTMPICEIESYRRMPGQTEFGTNFSIYATIRVVGRSSLLHIVDGDESQGVEFLTGWCTEVFDSAGSNDEDTNRNVLKKANDYADQLEEMMETVCKLEDKLETLSAKGGMPKGAKEGSEEVSEATMRRRILEAELDELNDEEDVEDDDYDDEDEDDDDDSEEGEDRRSRFQRALKVAEATDMQGYRTSSSPSTSMRSIQELTALSWAYFNSEEEAMDIIQYRLRALEGDDLAQRLKLALLMLMESRSKLKAKVENFDK